MTDYIGKIDVLDHGFVRYIDHCGSDLSIVRAARVSHNADWRTGKDSGKDEKLIRYMFRNRHTSPFESCSITFEVKAPIFVFRQWHRHRTWSYNEVSARYSELPEEFYVPSEDVVGVQSASNKQVREMNQDIRDENVEIMLDYMREHNKRAFQLYKTMLKAEIPRELARTVLPLATYSRMFATVNLYNLMHFLQLRLHDHAQWEIREYAKALADIVTPIFPVAMHAFLSDLQEAEGYDQLAQDGWL